MPWMLLGSDVASFCRWRDEPLVDRRFGGDRGDRKDVSAWRLAAGGGRDSSDHIGKLVAAFRNIVAHRPLSSPNYSAVSTNGRNDVPRCNVGDFG